MEQKKVTQQRTPIELERNATMLAKWTELLPLFIVRKLAAKNCEVLEFGGMKFVRARKDVLVITDGDIPPTRPKNVPPAAPRPPEALRRMRG